MAQSPPKPSQTWDLSDLYQGLADQRLQADLTALQEEAMGFRDRYYQTLATRTPAEILAGVQALEGILEKSGYLYAYPSLRFAADTRDRPAQQALDQLLEQLTALENQVLFFLLELKDLSAQQFSQLEQAPELRPYQHYFHSLALARPHKLPEAVEQTRNQMALTGRQSLIQLRAVHQGELEYEPVRLPDGAIATTEAELNALLFHADATLRRKAYESVRRVLQEHNSLYGFILNTLAQDHRIENQMRGYPSTLAKQLLLDQVSESVFHAIMDGTARRFDLFQRYYRLKGKALGQRTQISDIYAPWPQANPMTVDYETGVEMLLAALGQFDPHYGAQAEVFFRKNWVDAQVRPGKRSGAFCSFIYGKHSYLLLSYTEDYDSLFTLAHEMGHGLHFAWSGDRQSYFNSHPPMILAEIASTFNELLLLDYWLQQASEDWGLRRSLLTRQIEDQLNLLFRQSTISRLELAIHERAMTGSFDATFVNQTWQELYGQLCGEAIDLLPVHQYDWARIGHIFFKPYYCYQYTASTIVSLACYQQYREVGKAFIPGYLELLAAGGSLDQVGALKKFVGVDLEDPQTIAQALGYVEDLIQSLEALWETEPGAD